MRKISFIIVTFICIILFNNKVQASNLNFDYEFSQNKIMIMTNTSIKESDTNKSKTIGKINKYNVVDIIGESNGFIQISDGNRIGYIKKCKYLRGEEIRNYISSKNKKSAKYIGTIYSHSVYYNNKKLSKVDCVIYCDDGGMISDFNERVVTIKVGRRYRYVEPYSVSITPIFTHPKWRN